jgi:hypothetical protein
MTYTNCIHRIWICNPSSGSTVIAAVITAAAAIVRVGLAVVTVIVNDFLLFNFCLHAYLAFARL